MTGQNNFKFTAQTKDTRQLEQIFDSPVSLTQPLTANGEINTSSKFIKIETKAPFMKYQQADVKESIFNLTNENEKMNLTAHTRYFKDDNRMELYVNADAESDTIRSQINYSNETPIWNLGGQIDSYTFFGRNKKNQLITNFRCFG